MDYKKKKEEIVAEFEKAQGEIKRLTELSFKLQGAYAQIEELEKEIKKPNKK